MLAEIRRWHVTPKSQGGRGWRDIGYHAVFFPDGKWLPGRKLTEIGAGAIGFNNGWVHVCMIPINTVTRMGNILDYYNREQVEAVRNFLADLETMTKITRIAGHNEVAAKLCPGFKVKEEDWR
jgi:hypothetical protein